MYAVIFGNFTDGFRFYGPISTGKALKFIKYLIDKDLEKQDAVWSIVELKQCGDAMDM